MNYVDIMKQEQLIYLKLDKLAEELAKQTGESVDYVKFNLLNLIKDGVLFMDEDSKVSVCKDRGYIKARLTLNKKGYGFAVVEGHKDFFVPAYQINGAFDGDDCLVEITNMKSEESVEARVVKVLTRNTTHVVGTYIVGKGKNVVLPDDSRLPQIRIYKGNALNAKNNEKVWVELENYSEESEVLHGKVIEVLGLKNTPKAEQLSIIRAHKIKETFDDATLNEAKNIKQTVVKEKYKDRADFTKLKTITIDGEDARDFDDAISIEVNKDGYTLYVHIADVTNYVVEGGALDKEALNRGTSVYFPNQVIPMLPKELSNGICSLNEGENRLTMSVVMQFDKNLNYLSGEIKESIIKSNHRMTYTEIGAILADDNLLKEKYADVYNDILLYQKFSNKLKEERLKRGEIRFNLPEPFILENAEGEIVSIGKRLPDEPHEIIESLMIKANEVVAEFANKLKIPIVYRVHEKPDSEKVTRLANQLTAMGIYNTLLIEGDKPVTFQRVMEKIAGTAKEKTLSMLTLRSMMKARYLPNCLGHFGLASTYYCHFTSPIRRYPDLIVHRMLKKFLHGKTPKELQKEYKIAIDRISDVSSTTEKNADEAEREVDDYKKALYMTKFLGEEFDATISGVQEYGLFVELENGIEGLLRADCLPFDVYVYDETGLTLKGKKHKYEIGDSLRVVVASANVNTRQIDFDLPGGGKIGDFVQDKSEKQKVRNGKTKKNEVKVVNRLSSKPKKLKDEKTYLEEYETRALKQKNRKTYKMNKSATKRLKNNNKQKNYNKKRRSK